MRVVVKEERTSPKRDLQDLEGWTGATQETSVLEKSFVTDGPNATDVERLARKSTANHPRADAALNATLELRHARPSAKLDQRLPLPSFRRRHPSL